MPKRVSVLEIEQAILNLYDDYVLQNGPDEKHVYFVACQNAVAKKLGTTPARVAGALGGPDFAKYKTDLLVRKGRGFYLDSPPYVFFMGYDLDEYYKP